MITPHPVSTHGAPTPTCVKDPDRYPLTSLQQGMLYHWLKAPHSGVDIEQVVCVLREEVDFTQLRSAWTLICARHSVLRARFCMDGNPEQEILTKCSPVWSEQDLSKLSPDQHQRSIDGFLQQDRRRGFDLTVAPLWRLTLLRLGDADYRLIWTFHHAILDGRSFTTILREVFAAAEFIAPGRDPEFTELPDFGSFARWRSQLDSSSSEQFWRTMLGDITAPTPLPIKGLPDCSLESAPGDAEVRLSRETTVRLTRLAEANGLTLNTLLQGAWAILLSRYSGENDVLFGATRACRHGSVTGAAEMVGLLINTLPVRTRVEPNSPLLPWLKELRSLWTAMREHEHTPLTQIQGWSAIPGDQRLFDTLVVYENRELTEAVDSRSPTTGAKREFRLYEQTGLGLTLTAFGGDELLLRLEYNESEFSRATAVRTLRHVEVLLKSFATNPQCLLGDLSILTSEEREDLTTGWNPPVQTPAPEATLHELFRAQASQTPEAVALSCEGQTVTYAELDQCSDALAAHLQSLGVGPEVLVGLRVERTNTMIVALLAILKAGGAYLPIDLSYPPDRVAFMFFDAAVSVLLTESHLAFGWTTTPQHVVCLDRWKPDTAQTLQPSSAGPDNLAYVIYTSGSTGQPKGCMVTHRNVTRLFSATQHWFQFDMNDVWTMFHSVAFDFSVWEIWGALLYGGRLVIVSHETSRSPEAFRTLLAAERVTVLNQTPSAFRQLIVADQVNPTSNDLHLRYIIFGGEALEMQSLRPWFDRHGEKKPRLVNMYGITETTVHVTYRPISANDLGAASVIGIPIPDLQLYVLDRDMRPVPIGVPGEMHVGGGGVARGYLHREVLTEQRFLTNPFMNGEDNSPRTHRLYRTGDLARWLPGRDLEYLGRIDHQVKIRGFRVELGEIQSVLSQHAAIRECVVVARTDDGEKRLVAYYVYHNVPPSSQDLRAHLRARLPNYMVPAIFIPLDCLPLTSNGKIDHRALPCPAVQPGEQSATAAIPRTALEQEIAALWRDLLKVENVGLDSNFFELGGHSLLLIQLHSRLRAAQGGELSITELFQHPTVRTLAKRLSQNAKPAPASLNVQVRGQRQRAAWRATARTPQSPHRNL